MPVVLESRFIETPVPQAPKNEYPREGAENFEYNFINKNVSNSQYDCYDFWYDSVTIRISGNNSVKSKKELLPRKSVDMFDTVMVMKNHTSQIMYTWGKLIINKIILHVNIIYDVHT